MQSKKVYVQVHPHPATFPEWEQKHATVQFLHRPQGATRAITKGTIADKKETLNGFVDWCLKKVVIQMIP
ncbi:hypothetical protein [Microcoleus sp. AT3-D2]|uniref:hypothetical protein n=1 Tax=Microcoleus sp. AT3-D2 TaxID=2818612 RepID=UPI002FD62A6D